MKKLTAEYIQKVRGWMQGMEDGDGESMNEDVDALCDMALSSLKSPRGRAGCRAVRLPALHQGLLPGSFRRWFR